MYPRLTRAGLASALVLVAAVAAQDRGVMPGSFTGARPAGAPGGSLGGSNLGGAPATGGGIVGGPGMPGGLGGFRGTEKSWHCPRCQREVAKGTQPPASAVCCGQNFVNGENLHGGASAPQEVNPADTATRPPDDAVPMASPVGPVSDPEPSGNGSLIGLGIAIIVVGLMTLGVVIFLALRARQGHPRRVRRHRVRE